MNDTPEAEETITTENVPAVVDIETNQLAEAALAFRESVASFDKTAYTDKRQKGGRWAPVFPALHKGTKREEEYIERMIQKDKELNLG